MRVQYITSACVLVEHRGVRVLCDPWLTEGIYYGSWFHYPPLRFRPEDFSDVDFLHLSHIHPDHVDPDTLRRLPRSLPILIHDYEDKFLFRLLAGIGFQEIREVPHGEAVRLGEDFTMELLAADNCDPMICGRFFGCQISEPYRKTIQLDSLALVQGGGQTVLNANDSPYGLARGVCDHVLKRCSKVDLALLGYGGAGEYPQCFEMDRSTLEQRGQQKRRQFLKQAADYLRHLRPARFMPFGGQYTLGGKLAP